MIKRSPPRSAHSLTDRLQFAARAIKHYLEVEGRTRRGPDSRIELMARRRSRCANTYLKATQLLHRDRPIVGFVQACTETARPEHLIEPPWT